MPGERLTLRELNRATLARQGLLHPLAAESAAAEVRSLGAIQAQHPDWPSFALLTRRNPAKRPHDIVAERTARRIVRASLMRMTVHLVAADDFWPMSLTTIGHRRDQFRALFKVDPATSELGRALTKAQPSVLAAMEQEPLAIAEIEEIIRTRVHDTEVPGNRAAWRHFSSSIPLVMVPFPGEAYGRGRYLPAASWLGPAPAGLDERDAARQVAERYLAAFGPASPEDFAAFISRGRRAPPLREAIESLGERLVRLRDERGRTLLDLADAPRPSAKIDVAPRLLARWDSLLLAYTTKDRARVLPPEYQAAVITRNADVLPTFLVDGFVAGTWLPRRSAGGEPYAELRPFASLTAADRRALDEEARRLVPALAEGAFTRYPGTD